MKKYNGATITVSNDDEYYGDCGDISLSETIEGWEDFLVEKFGLTINCPGGDSITDYYQVNEYPDNFDEMNFDEDACEDDYDLEFAFDKEFADDMHDAWAEFFNQ